MIAITRDPAVVVPPISEHDIDRATIICVMDGYIGIAVKRGEQYFRWATGIKPFDSFNDTDIADWVSCVKRSYTWGDTHGHNLISLLIDSFQVYGRANLRPTFYVCDSLEDIRVAIRHYRKRFDANIIPQDE
jgi:hypothetical protein